MMKLKFKTTDKILSEFEKIICINCSPGWSGYISEKDFNKAKDKFIKKLTKLFSLKILNNLYDAITSKIIKLDSGDLKSSLINKNKVKIKEYDSLVFDKNLKSDLMIILFFGYNNKITIRKIEQITKQYSDISKKTDNIIWGIIESEKEKMIIIC